MAVFKTSYSAVNITKRYFVNKDGVPTTRMQGEAGKSHYEAASAVEKLTPGTCFYQQMFKLKYIRVAEDAESNTIYIDSTAPSIDRLTNGQRRWVDEKRMEGKTISFNSKEFRESRDAQSVVAAMLA